MKRNRIVLLALLLVFTAVVAGCTSTGGQQAASETPSKADASGEDTQIEGTSPSDVSEDSAVIVTNGGSKIRLSSLEYYVESEDAPWSIIFPILRRRLWWKFIMRLNGLLRARWL